MTDRGEKRAAITSGIIVINYKSWKHNWRNVGFNIATGDNTSVLSALRAEVDGKYTNDCRNYFLENDYVSTLG